MNRVFDWIFARSPSGFFAGLFTGVFLSFGTNVLAAVGTASARAEYALPAWLYIASGLSAYVFFSTVERTKKALEFKKTEGAESYETAKRKLYVKYGWRVLMLLLLMLFLLMAGIVRHMKVHIPLVNAPTTTTAGEHKEMP